MYNQKCPAPRPIPRRTDTSASVQNALHRATPRCSGGSYAWERRRRRHESRRSTAVTTAVTEKPSSTPRRPRRVTTNAFRCRASPIYVLTLLVRI